MTGVGAPTPDGSALCASCGMCCDGTLFDRIPVTPQEEADLGSLGFGFVPFEEQTVFELPCKALSCKTCTIYQARPAVCRGFRCWLLKCYESGEVGFEDAQAIQDEARRLIAAVTADNPDAGRNGPRHRLRSRFALIMQDSDPGRRRAVAPQFLNIVALDAFLERWFRKKESTAEAPRIPE